MPVSCLKYTSLGEPDKRLNCKNFDKLEQTGSISMFTGMMKMEK